MLLKKKKKIYLTQNEIQKLIDKKKDDVNIESDIEENIDELIKDENQENLEDLADQADPTTVKKYFKKYFLCHNINCA